MCLSWVESGPAWDIVSSLTPDVCMACGENGIPVVSAGLDCSGWFIKGKANTAAGGWLENRARIRPQDKSSSTTRPIVRSDKDSTKRAVLSLVRGTQDWSVT